MSWRAITEDDVLSGLTDTIGLAMRAALRKPGQTDPLEQIRPTVVAEVREAVRSHPRNREHSDPTYVPEATIRHAVALIRLRLAERLQLGMEIPKDWQNAADDADKYLDKVAAGERAVEDPDGTAATSRAGTWNSENKIVGRTHPVPRPGSQYPSSSKSFANPANDA